MLEETRHELCAVERLGRSCDETGSSHCCTSSQLAKATQGHHGRPATRHQTTSPVSMACGGAAVVGLVPRPWRFVAARAAGAEFGLRVGGAAARPVSGAADAARALRGCVGRVVLRAGSAAGWGSLCLARRGT